MKKWSIAFVVILAIIFTATLAAQSPTKVNAKTIPGWFYYTMGTLTSTPSTPDSTADIYPGGYNLSSITISVADTVRDTCWVMLSTNAGTTWSPIAAQTLVSTTGAAQSYEIVLRDNDTDILDTITGRLHVSQNPAAAGNGVTGATKSHPVITVKLNYKP